MRSQGAYITRSLQGNTTFFTTYNHEQNQYVITITPGYIKSNKPGQIAEDLFGRIVRTCSWDIAKLSITGSGVESRNSSTDLLADYFGLPRDFSSSIILKPRIDSAIVEGDIYMHLNTIAPGLWAHVRLPLVHTRWNLHFDEHVIHKGTADHQPGYFNELVTFGVENPAGTYANAYGVARDDLLERFTDFIAHGKTPQLGTQVTFVPLRYARWASCNNKKTGIADIHIDVGYPIIHHDLYHITLGCAFVIPTGTRPTACDAFEPIVGNGRHGACGAILQAHYQLTKNITESSYCDLWLDAHITHLFSTKQIRTFDLKGKPNSRYMLAHALKQSSQQLYTNAIAGDVANSVPSEAQFDNIVTPIANISSMRAHVSTGIQADIVARLVYTKGPYSWDIGYNLWARSAERITIHPTDACTLNHHQWALKGDAQLYGFSGTVVAPATDPIALAPSQSCATITRGTNNITSLDTNSGGTNGIRPTRNPGIDIPAYARKTATASGVSQNINDRPDNLGLQMQTTVSPVYITLDDIDTVGAQTKGLSHSFFAGCTHTWSDVDTAYRPHINISAGGQAELHAIDHYCTIPENHSCTLSFRAQDCSSSRVCGISQWSIWIKVGIEY